MNVFDANFRKKATTSLHSTPHGTTAWSWLDATMNCEVKQLADIGQEGTELS